MHWQSPVGDVARVQIEFQQACKALQAAHARVCDCRVSQTEVGQVLEGSQVRDTYTSHTRGHEMSDFGAFSRPCLTILRSTAGSLDLMLADV